MYVPPPMPPVFNPCIIHQYRPAHHPHPLLLQQQLANLAYNQRLSEHVMHGTAEEMHRLGEALKSSRDLRELGILPQIDTRPALVRALTSIVRKLRGR